MNSTRTNRYEPDSVAPPGETLEETIDARGMSQAELADRMGRPKKTINEIIQAKTAITQDTALQLERVLGIPAKLWMNLEANYREFLARSEEQERLEKHRQWSTKFPVKAMIHLGWIPESSDRVARIQNLLNFFGVASPEVWEESWSEVRVSFRQSVRVSSDPHSIAAWLRKGESEGERIPCQPFDEEKFRSSLSLIRRLTIAPPEEFAPKVRSLCAASGVAVAFVPELPKAPICGATRWISPDRALLQLSLRYRTDDHLWFTFFHEAGHILKHGKREVFLEGDGKDNTQEREADAFAAKTLIPDPGYRRFVAAGRYGEVAIRAFASEVGIAPGIVVGRLQHEGRISYSQCNELKRRLRWASAQ